jgi:hypothetical protein
MPDVQAHLFLDFYNFYDELLDDDVLSVRAESLLK